MAETYKQLTAANAQLGSSSTLLYTVPASTKAHLKTITLHNTNTSTEAVELNLVASGLSAAAANKFLNIDLEASETIEWSPSFPFTMEAAGTVYGLSTSSSVVNVKIDGAEVT